MFLDSKGVIRQRSITIFCLFLSYGILCKTPGCHRTHTVDHAALELTKIHLQSAGIKSIHHHCPAKCLSFLKQKFQCDDFESEKCLLLKVSTLKVKHRLHQINVYLLAFYMINPTWTICINVATANILTFKILFQLLQFKGETLQSYNFRRKH